VAMIALVVLSSAIHVHHLLSGPLVRFFQEAGRFPDLEMFIDILKYDPESREINFTIQMRLQTSLLKQDGIWIRYDSPLSRDETTLLYVGKFGDGYSYQANTKRRVIGIDAVGERFPYDTYGTKLSFYSYLEKENWDFPEGFVPRVKTSVAYPKSIGWQVDTACSSVATEYNTGKGIYTLDFYCEIAIQRMGSYRLLFFAPILAANLAVGSTLLMKRRENDEGNFRGRMAIYVPVLVFISTFLYTLRIEIPARFGLSVAEGFVVSLMINVSMMVFVSVVERDYDDQIFRKVKNAFIVSCALLPLGLILFSSFEYWLWLVRQATPWYLHPTSFLWAMGNVFEPRSLLWSLLLSVFYYEPVKDARTRKRWLLILSIGAIVLFVTTFNLFADSALVLVSYAYVGVGSFYWVLTARPARPVRETYPDIVAVDQSGREARIEVEFESGNFEREHMDEADKCDIIVCWRDTWGRAAIKPVIELASILY